MSAESEERQISTFLYCLGAESEDILSSTNITEENRKTYAGVVNQFDEFYKVRRNIIFERARFNRRNQLDGEMSEQYIAILYNLADTCEYGELKNEMIRDRLVVGIRDTALSESLQMDASLTLEKAKTKIRQKEAVRKQQDFLQHDLNRSDLHVNHNKHDLEAVKSKPQPASKRKPHQVGWNSRKPERNWKRPVYSKKDKCTRCGNNCSDRKECPAKGATCYKCRRRGHFGSQCYAKDMSEINPQDALGTAFLGTVGVSNSDRAWFSYIRLGDKEIQFKLDTGAEVTAISEKVFQTLPNILLQRPVKWLYGPNRKALQVIGQFECTLSVNHRSTSQTVFVVRELRNNLIGLPAIEALQPVTRIEEIKTVNYEQKIRRSFPRLFRGLGNLGEPYRIQLRSDAKPKAIYTPRQVPFPLRARVKQELDWMDK